jgi:hypothetical protein
MIVGLLTFAQSPRLSLYEEFTGETCPPCASANPALNLLLAQPANHAKVVAIKWQVPIPSAPSKLWSLYQTNKTEINWRYATYGYGINSAPSGRMDGQNTTVFGATNDHPNNLNGTVISTAASYTTAFNITMARAWTPGCTAITLTVNIQATAPFTSVGNLIFRTVMVERVINFSVQPGTNGEKDFEDVAIKSFPSIQSGVAMASTWTMGQTQTFTLTCAVPSYTRRKDQIAFVGFIQDDGNRKVAQAARTTTATVPPEAIAAVGAKVGVTCSSAISPVVSVRNDGVSAITNLTLTPKIDGTPGSPISWTGNLAVGATTNITLTGVTTPTTVGSHLFSFDVVMGVPLYNLTANQNSVSYLVATNYQGTPVAEGFVAAAYPPVGWTHINSDGGASWTRVTGSGGFNLSTQCTKYDFYSNTNVGDKDELYLPPLDMSASPGAPELSMDIAYSQRNVNSNDKLEVFASDNCGANWTSVFSQSGGAMATYGPVASSAYVPDNFDASHWKTEVVQLLGFNKPNLIVKLVVTSDNGNNLYLDNINLVQGNGVGISSLNKSNTKVNVYPNPANTLANVTVQSLSGGTAKITVVNSIGQLVYSKQANLNEGSNSLQIDLKDCKTGLHTIVIETNEGAVVKKLNVIK